ncbi:MAG: transposase [Candidatus Uhrbacteria bacterium]
MGTTPRVLAGGVVYHVLNRANDRRRIFQTAGDYIAFLDTFVEAQRLYPDILCFAFCVMPNHWHLVLRPEHEGELTDFLHWMTTTHAKRWRAFHRSEGHGHLYQGRFKSFPVQDDGHFLTVCRYVERNSLRAQLVERAELWRWSSVGYRTQGIHGLQSPIALHEWPVRRPHDGLQWINRPLAPAEIETVRHAVQHGRPFGTPDWCERIADRLGIQLTPHPRGRPRKH